MVTSPDSENDTATEIMHAACRVLAREGYADLTTQKIADECDKSQGLIHYYYNTKEDIFVAVIDHLINERAAQLTELPTENAAERLAAFLDLFLPPTPDIESRAHSTVNVAIHAQAPYHSVYRDRLAERNRIVQETLTEIIEDGIEQGQFSDVDPEKTAVSFLSMIDGAIFREVALDQKGVTETVREVLVSTIYEPGQTEDTS